MPTPCWRQVGSGSPGQQRAEGASPAGEGSRTQAEEAGTGLGTQPPTCSQPPSREGEDRAPHSPRKGPQGHRQLPLGVSLMRCHAASGAGLVGTCPVQPKPEANTSCGHPRLTWDASSSPPGRHQRPLEGRGQGGWGHGKKLLRKEHSPSRSWVTRASRPQGHLGMRCETSSPHDLCAGKTADQRLSGEGLVTEPRSSAPSSREAAWPGNPAQQPHTQCPRSRQRLSAASLGQGLFLGRCLIILRGWSTVVLG